MSVYEDDWDDEPCQQCPGYCDDHQTYNLRPFSETGGAE